MNDDQDFLHCGPLGFGNEKTLPQKRAVLIDDDFDDDIGGAQSAGIPGILVRSGKFRASDEMHTDIRPALVVDDFPAVVAALLGR